MLADQPALHIVWLFSMIFQNLMHMLAIATSKQNNLDWTLLKQRRKTAKAAIF